MGKKSSPAEVVTEEVVPAVQDFAHLAADRLSAAADKVGPLAHQAADAVSPYAQQAKERVAPYAQQAVDSVSPYAQHAADVVGDKVGPYAQQVSDTVGPYAKSAKQRGAQVAHDAVEKFGPVFEDALDKVPPAVEAARTKMHDDLFPKLAEALAAAAAAPLVVEATDRGKAVVAEAAGRGKAVVAATKGEVHRSQAEEPLAEAVGHRHRRPRHRGHRRPQAARQLGCGLASSQAHRAVHAEGDRTLQSDHLANQHLVGCHRSDLARANTMTTAERDDAPHAHPQQSVTPPLPKSAKQRGAQVAHDAVEKFGPVFEDALDKVPPAVEAARTKMHDDLLPKLAEALAAAAAAPIVVEATDRGKAVVAEAAGRGKAVVAAAKGEVPAPKPKSRWLKRLAIVIAVGGIAAIVARKLLGSSDADWQAARPTAPYVPKATAPSGPATSPASTWSAATDPTSATSANAVTAAETDDDAAATAAVEDEISAEATADQDPAEAESDQEATEPEAELGSESGEDVDPEAEDGEGGELPAEDAEAEGGEVSASGDTEGTSDDTK